MEPVFNTLPAGEILLRVSKKAAGSLARFTAPSWDEHLKTRWRALAGELGEADAAGFWHAAVQRGGVYRDPPAASPVSLALADGKLGYTRPAFEGDGQFVFLTYPHPMLHDGRGANKPWLMENADPVTKITWHSWVEVSPKTAASLDVRDGEIVELTSPYGSVEGPVYVYPGIRDDAVAIPLGFGHTAYGSFAQGRGRQRPRPARRAAWRLRALSLHPGLGPEDRPLPEARERRRQSPAARPRHRRGDAAGGGEEGPDPPAGVSRGGAREARGQHRARARGDPRLVGGAASRHRARGLRQGASPVGHVDRPGQVHRVLGVRHRLLRREQHSDGG